MLRLLTDEHFSPAVAEQVAAQHPDIWIASLHRWQGGSLLRAGDETILTASAEQGLTLVTYDQRTVVPLLKEWGESGRSHGGVILVDEKTIAQNDRGGQVRALVLLWARLGDLDWADRVIYLRP